MKNPLIRRLPRELKSDAGKYLIIFTFMIILIGFVSGFLVASGSLMKIYDDSFEKYNIEDGNFEFYLEADEAALDKIETDGDIRIYENFYIECETGEVDSTLRIYKKREEINKLCIHEGKLPVNADEIAIDRMYADCGIPLTNANVVSHCIRQSLVKEGLGIAFSTMYMGKQEKVDLRYVPVENPRGPWHMKLYWRKDRVLTASEEKFKNFVKKIFKN